MDINDAIHTLVGVHSKSAHEHCEQLIKKLQEKEEMPLSGTMPTCLASCFSWDFGLVIPYSLSALHCFQNDACYILFKILVALSSNTGLNNIVIQMNGNNLLVNFC